jgi:stage IV sporulation protein FB
MFKIKVHPLFLMLLFLSGLTGKISELVLAFFSVLIHEIAHILTALGFGYHTVLVEIFPFGGVARMEYSLFNDPVAEAITAIAGPVQSLLLALLAKAFSPFLHLPEITQEIFNINLGLALFNILPLYPLDGGRILRSLLVGLGGYKTATRRVVRLTKIVTIISGLPLLFLYLRGIVPPHFPGILLFLFISAREDNFLYAYLMQRDKKTALLKQKGLLSSKIWVAEQDKKVGEVLPFLAGKNYHIFYLRDKSGKISGELTEEELISILKENSLDTNLYQIWINKGGQKGYSPLMSNSKKI